MAGLSDLNRATGGPNRLGHPLAQIRWATVGHLSLGHLETRMDRRSCWPKPSWATVGIPWPGPHTPLGVGRWATSDRAAAPEQKTRKLARPLPEGSPPLERSLFLAAWVDRETQP
jgi:hypothetical protein